MRKSTLRGVLEIHASLSSLPHVHGRKSSPHPPSDFWPDFDQIFGQVVDQVFRQVFDQGGGGEEYSFADSTGGKYSFRVLLGPNNTVIQYYLLFTTY